ncbi:MAG TPA: amidohydrolase [Actinocrinis sp.]|nr:amidohydrolase [Actinocrinis sp.]
MKSDPVLAALLAAVPGAVPAAVELYLRSHRDPELSGAEKSTAARLAARLAATGLDVTGGVGGHGVVAVLRNGAGPAVMLRTELDALPVREQTGLPYASTATALDASGREVPVMHACGHDLHLACVAGAAEVLAAQRAHWQGTLIVVGQPAEETLSGAQSMLADGLYERFDTPAAVLAQHTAPLPAGMIAYSHGPVTAASASVHVVIHGRGGHASSPHLAVDPVLTAAAIVLRLQGIVARETSPADQAAVTVGAIHAGRTTNIIPDQATLDITIRALSQDTLERSLASVRRIIAAECDAAGNTQQPDITLVSKSPANVPDPSLAAAVRVRHVEAFGPERVTYWPASLAAEDFPLFGPAGSHLHGKSEIRTAYWMLGVVGPAQWSAAPGTSAAEKLTVLPPNHAPDFRPDPRLSIPAGISALAAAFLAALP